MANETPSRPPPLMANAIKNFHFDYLHTSLICICICIHCPTGPQYSPDYNIVVAPVTTLPTYQLSWETAEIVIFFNWPIFSICSTYSILFQYCCYYQSLWFQSSTFQNAKKDSAMLMRIVTNQVIMFISVRANFLCSGHSVS